MRKAINILLGMLIALLAGCKSQQQAVKQDTRPAVMYGPPSYFEANTQQSNTEQQ
jgi:hypothetical protein